MVLMEEAALHDGTLSLSLPFACDIRTAAGMCPRGTIQKRGMI